MSSTPSSTSVLSTESVSSKRKRARRENYTSGTSRSAYRFQQSLEQSFSSDSSFSCPTPGPVPVARPGCKRYCIHALRDLQEAFAAISKHPAKTLQNRKASYPTPKKQNTAHQNFTGIIKFTPQKQTITHTPPPTAQSQWLRENVLDAHGNFLYCQECIMATLGVHSQRLHRQRVVKQNQKHHPIVQMTKSEVVQQKLENFVLHENEEVQTFSVWWMALAADEEVEVQFPHERHGLAGRCVRLNSVRYTYSYSFDNVYQPLGYLTMPRVILSPISWILWTTTVSPMVGIHEATVLSSSLFRSLPESHHLDRERKITTKSAVPL